MRNLFIGLILTMAGILAVSSLATARSPQAASSTPDLTGVWKIRPGGSPYIFTSDPLPMKPPAQQQYDYNKNTDDPEQHGRDELAPHLRCYPPGMPAILTIPRPFEIVQIPGRILIHYEWDHWSRQIYMDGRAHPEGWPWGWMGHSTGKWDGDTLVVDTVSLSDQTWLDLAGHVHSDALHVVERLRRTSRDTLVDDLTFEDSKMYTKPFKGQKVFQLIPNGKIAEHFVCEDRLLRESRDREKP